MNIESADRRDANRVLSVALEDPELLSDCDLDRTLEPLENDAKRVRAAAAWVSGIVADAGVLEGGALLGLSGPLVAGAATVFLTMSGTFLLTLALRLKANVATASARSPGFAVRTDELTVVPPAALDCRSARRAVRLILGPGVGRRRQVGRLRLARGTFVPFGRLPGVLGAFLGRVLGGLASG